MAKKKQSGGLARHKEDSKLKAVRDVSNQMLVIQYKFETSPPLSRTEILSTVRKRVNDLDVLVGKKNGSGIFRQALIDIAAYVCHAAAACEDKMIGIE